MQDQRNKQVQIKSEKQIEKKEEQIEKREIKLISKTKNNYDKKND